jgi:hypothetical protein
MDTRKQDSWIVDVLKYFGIPALILWIGLRLDACIYVLYMCFAGSFFYTLL